MSHINATDKMTADEAIAALKTEIARYELLKRTEEAWAQCYRNEQGARETRDLFQLAFLAMERFAKRGDLSRVSEIAAEVRAIALTPEGALRREWWSGSPTHPEDPMPSQETLDFRHEATSGIYRKHLADHGW